MGEDDSTSKRLARLTASGGTLPAISSHDLPRLICDQSLAMITQARESGTGVYKMQDCPLYDPFKGGGR
jgi:hypothetical protein